jgi:hypothetical protein
MAKSKEVKIVMPTIVRNKLKEYSSKLPPSNYMLLSLKERTGLARRLDSFVESLMVTMPHYFTDVAIKEAEVSRRMKQAMARKK